MNNSEISNVSAQLLQSLQLEQQQCNWHALLSYLMQTLSASSGRLLLGYPHKRQFTIGQQQDYAVSWRSKITIVLYFNTLPEQRSASEKLQRIAPVLKMAAQLGLTWLQGQREQQRLKNCSNHAGLAIFHLNQKSQIQHNNALAQQLFRQGLLNTKRGALYLKDQKSWLQDSIQALQGKKANASITQLTLNGQTAHCQLLYQPGQHSSWSQVSPAYVLLINLSQERPSPLQLESLFGLNSSEAEVASWFCAGLKASEVADKTGYSVHTVYSYLKKLYQQTGLNKQSQLAAATWPRLPV